MLRLHRFARSAWAPSILSLTLACTQHNGPQKAEAAIEAASPAGEAAAESAEVAAAPALKPQAALVLHSAFVRRQPNDAKLVAVAGKKAKQGNYLATLYRGEAVWVRADKEGWLDVTLSDESHGWVKKDGLLMGPNLKLATVLSRARLFTRPDLLALFGGRAVEPGTLLIVLRDKDQFSEVNYNGQQTAWVLTALLVQEPQEVDAAKLVHRARLLQERKDPAAGAVIELLQGQFGATRLVAALHALQPAASQAPSAPPSDWGAPQEAHEAAPEADVVTPASTLQLAPAAPTQDPNQAPARTGGAPGLQGWTPPATAPAPPPADPSGIEDAPDLGPHSDVPDGTMGP